jgi:hypothetical protein
MPKEEQKTIPLDDEDGTTVNKIGVRIPAFWPEEPELWFAQVEGQFALSGTTDDDIKYAYVLSRIEPKQAREIRDIIRNPPLVDKYKTIKTALVQRLSDSQEQRIRQLLEHEEIGDRRPSQFLRHLSTLAGTTVSNELLRTLWIGRLPPQTQAILATRTDDNLQAVAEQADRIHEVNSRALVLATTQPPTPAATTVQQAWTTQMEMLTKQVAALTTQMANWAKTSRRGRSRSRTRDYTQKRERSKTPKQEGVCYYHRRFGAEARKCTQPCTYQKNEEGNH